MTTQPQPSIPVTGKLITATVVASGLFGSGLDRAAVATPAWRALGVQAWADYSRDADLRNGIIVYPVGGILCWVLAFAAALAYHHERSAPRQAGVPIHLAAFGALGAIVTTAIAAPTMLRVGRLTDPDALRNAFKTFTLWGVYARGGFFAVIFGCSVWALVAYLRNNETDGCNERAVTTEE